MKQDVSMFVMQTGSSCQAQSDDPRMYCTSAALRSLSRSPSASLWSVDNEQSLAHISSELDRISWPLNTDVLSTESAGLLSLERHRHYDMWLTASVFMFQLSNLIPICTCTRCASSRFDINDANTSLCLVPNAPNMNICMCKIICSSINQVLFWYSIYNYRF